MKTLACLAIAASFAAPALAAREYTVIDLGTLGGPGSYGAAIANDGTVVGCADVSPAAAHAFAWRDGAMRDLGTGGGAAEGSSCALAVNGQGQVAGRSTSGELVAWSAQGAVTKLGIQGDIGGIGEGGAIVGAARSGTSTRAFVYDGGRLLTVGGDFSAALAINRRGEVVGRENGRAVVFAEGGVRDLGPGTARDINDRGVIVGQGPNANAQPTAVLYGGSLAAPAYSTAIALNNRGQVVGSGEGIFGWVYDEGVVTRLGDLPAVTAGGYRRVEPTGINDQGWIVATASNAEGNLRAIVLVPANATKAKPLKVVSN